MIFIPPKKKIKRKIKEIELQKVMKFEEKIFDHSISEITRSTDLAHGIGANENWIR